jgi:arylsulfatase A-like enzyme
LITCHDLGQFLGCYGVPTVQTPSIDVLAATGARFTNAFTTAPQCSPSRAALATGRYPHCNGVLGLTHARFAWDLNPGEQTIGALLRGRGYETHLFGLQHITPGTNRLGFDVVHTRGLGPVVSDEVSAFLDQASGERPFYLEINLEEPHRPFDQGGIAPDSERGVTVPPYIPDSPAAREEFAAFQGAVAAADRAVGRILAALDRTGRAEQTLVVFTTDHGVAMPRAKCTLYDPGLETALLVRWPAAGISGGNVVDALLSNIDLLPTLLDLSGTPIPPAVQGRSFWPLLRGEPYRPRAEIFAEKTYHSYADPMRAIRTERYKYIRNFEATFLVEVPGDIQEGAIFRADPSRYVGATHPAVELYDLATDPLEQANRAGDPALTTIQDDLDQRLWSWMEATADPLLAGPVPSPAYRHAIARRPVLS